ncbi:MAG: universal stress protein [Candidatus Riflebacteria bacterium]|nr:universal stress protein [Candidatus Riflebacteria bacterium]
MLKIAKILVPIDFSDASAQAFDYAASFASEYGSEIHLLHVVEEDTISLSIGGDPLNVAKSWEVKAAKMLDEFVPAAYKDLPILKRVRSGDVSKQILEYAKKEDISLIVVGSHGKTGFIDSWLGGITYELVRKAPCSVLTVDVRGKTLLQQPRTI